MTQSRFMRSLSDALHLIHIEPPIKYKRIKKIFKVEKDHFKECETKEYPVRHWFKKDVWLVHRKVGGGWDYMKIPPEKEVS